MEVTLNQTVIDCYDEILSQTIRKEETQDAVVSDALPDVGELVCTTGVVMIRSKDVGEGHVRLEANVQAKVVYAPEEGEGLYCMEVGVPLYVSLEDERFHEDCCCTADIRLLSLDTKILNPRKLSLRAEAAFTVCCYAPSRLAAASAPAQPEEHVNLLERKVAVTPVTRVAEKTFVLTDEFSVPASMPPAESILSQSVDLQTEDVKPVGSKLVVKGSARSSILYRAEDMSTGIVEFSTGFSQIMEAEVLPEDPCVTVALLPSGAFYEVSGGDGRTGNMELHLVIQAVIRGRAELNCLTDAYSNRYALEATAEPREFLRVREEVTLRETLREQFSTAKPVAEVLQSRAEPGAAQVDGGTVTLPVTVCLCFRAADGSLNFAKHTYQVRFIRELNDGQSLRVTGAAAQEPLWSPVSGGADLRLPVELTALLLETETASCISALSYDEGQILDLSDQPTLVILRAKSTDDLWTLAKENHSTVRTVIETNELESLAPGWEKLILIPKSV